MADSRLTTATSRRAILGALAIAMPAATFAAVGYAVERQDERNAGISPELPDLIAAAHAADNACRDYDQRVHEPARQRWLALCDRIPHASIEVSVYGMARTWSTAETNRVGNARASTRGRVSFDGPGSEQAREDHEARLRLVAAADARDARVRAASTVSGLEAAHSHMEGLEEHAYAAVKAIDNFPVAGLADLLAKLDYYDDVGSTSDNDVARVIAGDLRRLAALASSKEA